MLSYLVTWQNKLHHVHTPHSNLRVKTWANALVYQSTVYLLSNLVFANANVHWQIEFWASIDHNWPLKKEREDRYEINETLHWNINVKHIDAARHLYEQLTWLTSRSVQLNLPWLSNEQVWSLGHFNQLKTCLFICPNIIFKDDRALADIYPTHETWKNHSLWQPFPKVKRYVNGVSTINYPKWYILCGLAKCLNVA